MGLTIQNIEKMPATTKAAFLDHVKRQDGLAWLLKERSKHRWDSYYLRLCFEHYLIMQDKKRGSTGPQSDRDEV